MAKKTIHQSESKVNMSICNKCGRELPATLGYFHRDSKRLLGVHSTCRECRGYEFKKLPKPDYRICTKCGKELKEKDNFTFRSDTRTFRTACIVCEKLRYKEWNVANDYLIKTKRKEYWGKNREGLLKKGRVAYYKRRNTLKKVGVEKICPICNKPFRELSKGQKYCSRACQQVRSIKYDKIACSHCGGMFRAKGENNVYCSAECRNAKTPRNCEFCGKMFYRKKPNTRICSQECRHKKWAADNPLKRREFQARRRLLKKARSVEKVDYQFIAKRDGYKCKLCGKKVNMLISYPNPKSASFDHIIPLSLGGWHIARNIQLAHFSCNISKGNRVLDCGEQLRIF